ncbi:MAG: efflux RND transporter periplasmic adaptor subunit [Verrucomicrobia bacterium]|nr:efflux RND transporter periplasmic adaptor subunit [Verrucomicrobiota bacterium]MDA1203253.1 efflux RND transporter periplasmic adaptor subunit [Verrucomicrobiota bacterium]
MKLIILAAVLLAACSKQPEGDQRAVKFYQSPMHPWITSDQPGQCTICGMDLVPVYEGEEGVSTDPGTVTLMPSTAQIIGVDTAPVVRAPLEKSIRLSGVIEDDDTKHVIVSAFFDGRIDRVFVEHVGENVRAEQPLAQIYSPELLYIVREFQTAVRRGHEDPQAAVARQRLVQFGLTRAQVEELASGLREDFGLNFRSPVDGTLVVRNVYPGKYIKAGDMLFEIADFGVMWFHATVYEQDLPWIRVGAKARVTTPAAPGREFEGKVTLIDPTFDPETRSTRVRIEVPNPVEETHGGLARALPHRAYGEAVLTVAGDSVVLVPRSAVLDTGQRAVSYVDRGGGAYEKRDVRVGRRGDTSVEILGGLAEGEKVVTQGNLMIDAEAQMTQPESFGVGEAKPPHAVDDATMKRWTALSAAAAALAADDLAAFNASGAVTAPAADLGAARSAFYEAVTPAVEEALRHPGIVRVYECPMTAALFPGAPNKARWIQLDAPLRNPWFGAAMLECGSEVKP